MRVLVCGSRIYPDAVQVRLELSRLHAQRRITAIITGDCRGPDSWAADWSLRTTPPVELVQLPARWQRHGAKAGPLRNAKAIEEGRPDFALAFIVPPLRQSRGSFDMVKRLVNAGVRTLIIPAIVEE